MSKVVDATKIFASKVMSSPKTPKALLIGGVAVLVGGTVYACVQTVKSEKIVDNFKETVDNIKETKEKGTFTDTAGESYNYDEKMYKHDMIWAYGNLVKDCAIHFAGPVACIAVGTIMISGCYKLQMKQILKLQDEIVNLNNEIVTLGAVAYNAEETLRRYRKNVVDAEGEEADTRYMSGISSVKDVDIDIVDPETGEIRTKHINKKIDVIKDVSLIASQYAVFMDETDYFTKDPNTNLIQTERARNLAQVDYDAQGFITLYEIYTKMGVINKLSPRQIMASHKCGWVKGHGTDEIIFKLVPTYVGSESRFRDRVLIDFNCMGRIDDIVESGRYERAA